MYIEEYKGYKTHFFQGKVTHYTHPHKFMVRNPHFSMIHSCNESEFELLICNIIHCLTNPQNNESINNFLTKFNVILQYSFLQERSFINISISSVQNNLSIIFSFDPNLFPARILLNPSNK